MDKNLKFTDKETKLFYDMINEWVEIHFQDNSTLSFKHLYNLWNDYYRKDFDEYCGLKIKPYRFVISG